jgi:hypothetical protein
MIFRYAELHRHEDIFVAVTGLQVTEFDQLVDDLLICYGEAEQMRLNRPNRQRAAG